MEASPALLPLILFCEKHLSLVLVCFPLDGSSRILHPFFQLGTSICRSSSGSAFSVDLLCHCLWQVLLLAKKSVIVSSQVAPLCHFCSRTFTSSAYSRFLFSSEFVFVVWYGPYGPDPCGPDPYPRVWIPPFSVSVTNLLKHRVNSSNINWHISFSSVHHFAQRCPYGCGSLESGSTQLTLH